MLPYDTLDYNVTDFLNTVCQVVAIRKCSVNSKVFTFALISRRSVYRAGNVQQSIVYCLYMYVSVVCMCSLCVYLMLHYIEADNATAGCVTLCVLFV